MSSYEITKPIRCYLDTEFTDFTNPKLLSIGIVSEYGDEFYVELVDGWGESDCTDFVLEDVLPALVGTPEVQVAKADLKARLVAWLENLSTAPVAAKVVFDSEIDWNLLRNICGNLNTDNLDVQTEWLSWPGSSMARRFEDLLEDYFTTNAPRHNSLVDARAMRDAALQTEAEFRSQ